MNGYISTHQNKIIRYKSHADFLRKCLKEGIVPNGFSLQWEPQMEMDIETREKCDTVRKDASLKLIALTEQAVTSKVISLQETYSNIHNEHTEKLERVLHQKKQRKLQKARTLNFNVHSNNNSLDNFYVTKVKADGNCFYRCIALDIFGSQEKHKHVRDKIVEHMNSNIDQYSIYIDGDTSVHMTNQMFIDGRGSSWATEAEIYAVATVYSAIVQIYSIEHSGTTMLTFEPITKKNKIKHKMFLKLENQHYDFLKVKCRNHTSNVTVSSTESARFDWYSMEPMPDELETSRSIVEIAESRTASNGERSSTKANVHTHPEVRLSNKEAESVRIDQSSTVINLSSRELTPSEIALLSKGLKFIPTTNKYDVTKLHSDLLEWERRMRLKEYFHGKQSDLKEETKPWLKKKSNFTPVPGRDTSLDAYIEAVKRDVMSGLKDTIESNVSAEESKAMKTLLDDNNIVIRPADKGSGIVVVDTADYVMNMEKEMNDKESYQISNGNGKEESIKIVKKVANKLYREGLICKELKDYLIPKNPQEARVKGNPKIHKKDNPYRSIVNGIGTQQKIWQK